MTAAGSNTNRPLGSTSFGMTPRWAHCLTADALTPSRSAIAAAEMKHVGLSVLLIPPVYWGICSMEST